jgi:hypothetical protein
LYYNISKFICEHNPGNTFHLLDGTVWSVSSEDYLSQEMRTGTKSYGFQFHFEITKDMISEWLEAGQEEAKQMKDRNLPEKTLIGADTHIHKSHALAELFFNNYLGNIEAGWQSQQSHNPGEESDLLWILIV